MEEKINFTLRIPIEINKSIKELSDKMGISQNSIILLFIGLGLNSIDDITKANLEQFHRFLSQNQK